MPVSVILFPWQTVVVDDKMLIVGLGSTTIGIEVVLVQVPFEAVTVNMVEEPGYKVILEPVCAPGSQVKVFVPDAIRLTLLPEQILVGVALALIDGTGFTSRFKVLVLAQGPFVL